MKHVRWSIAVLLLCAATSQAQVVTGAVSGQVTDTTGAVMPGATVEVQNVETGFSRTVEADSSGRYRVANLPLGSYSVATRQPGFHTQVRSGITLAVGSDVVVNMQLTVGAVQETVEVFGEAPAIETTSATLSNLVNPEQMRELPLNGRDFMNLVQLSAGVISNPAGSFNPNLGTGLRLAVNGARPDANLHLLDGTVVNDPSGMGVGGATGANLGVEAIREFRVLTHSFSAEYGRNAGAVVSAVTRSGTNAFHGSAYEFLRNNVFDARNFFNPGELPPFRRNQFGASLGGPVLRDRIFFFLNYEGLRERQGVSILSTVPDLNARQGLLPDPATGQLRAVPFNPIIKPYLDLYPLPNGRNFGDGTAESIADISAPGTDDYAMQRMDFRLSDKDSVYWRYVYNPSEAAGPEPVPTFGRVNRVTHHFVALSEMHVFSGSSINEFRFAFNRITTEGGTGPVVPIDPALSFIPGQLFGTIQYTAGGGVIAAGGTQLTALGTSRNYTEKRFVQNRFQATDAFSTVKGAHSLKVGGDFERLQLTLLDGNNMRGGYTFGGLGDLLAARSSQFQFKLLGPNSTILTAWRRILLGWFIQDDIRVRPNLTLNLGLRHEFMTSPREVHGWNANLRHLTDPESTVGAPFLTPKANFAPRVGLAWDPTGSGKTSVRLGAGLFHNHLEGRNFAGQVGLDSKFVGSYSIRNPAFPNALARGFSAQAQATYSMIYNSDTPTLIHWNLEIQRQLAPTISLGLGYVGSSGYHLPRVASANIRIPQILPDGSKFFAANAPFLNPNFDSIDWTTTDAVSKYNAFQAVLRKSFSQSFQLQGSYTLAKAFSDADAFNSALIGTAAAVTMDMWDYKRDYSRSGYDQRHSFVFLGRYKMPWDNALHGRTAKAVLGGWATNGIFRGGSGLPFTVGVGFNNSRNGDRQQPDRPDLAPGASNDPIRGVTAGCQGIPPGEKLRTPDRYYDPCAFELSAAGTYGNLGRNTVTGPAQYNVDFTLMKTTSLSEKMNLEFRSEFFNLFNHPFFGIPSRGAFNSARTRNGNSARIVNTFNTGRQIQFGLKLNF